MNVARTTSALVIAILLTVACGNSAPEEAAVGTGTSRADTQITPEPLPGGWSKVGIITLDFQTLQLKTAYVTNQGPCDGQRPASDEELRWRAGGIFDAAGKYWSGQVKEEDIGRSEVLAFDISHVGDFAVLRFPPHDFGGVAVSHACSGLVLFAGSIIWAGRGEQLYPAVPIELDALQRTSGRAPSPERIDVVGEDVKADEEGGMAAWNSVRDLKLVRELAFAPYSVLVYLYPRTVGIFDPAAADWVIFVHRGSTR